jgi:hypothetical protein
MGLRKAARTMHAGLMAALLVLFLGQVAFASSKAFVVGNTTYAHAEKLPNAANDAGDLAGRLRSLGYQVTLKTDVDRRAFLGAFQAFVQSLAPDDLALFFYAGHGVQISGENYLFPTDALVEKESDARERLVPLNALLSDLSRSTRTRIVLLDACRNNPFAGAMAKLQAVRSAGQTRGLARVYAGVGSFIAYSTQPDNVARDGTGRNSPFTEALLRHVATTGVDVHGVMRKVRADVQAATAEEQIPWENSSLVDEVRFAGGLVSSPAGQPEKGPPASVPSQPAPPPVAQTFSYVTGLDPKGDNFLALRTSPDADGARIATMGPDTLLKVVESRGAWRRVELLDGLSGWAHGNWIACCRTVTSAAPSFAAAPPPRPPSGRQGESCDALWLKRNAIWHRNGYCFQTARGLQAFGNKGCTRDQPAARAAMTAADRAEIDALMARERELGCQ